MTQVIASAALPAPARPDADWDALRDAALLSIQEAQARALEPWTDHNVHDPGITLLEAALWALADLHYRTANRAWDSWPVEVGDWRGTSLARDNDLAIVGAVFADTKTTVPAAGAIAEAATSRTRAVSDLTGVELPGSEPPPPPPPLTGAAAAGVVRFLREPTLLRAAYDAANAVAEAVAGAASEDAAIAAAAAALDGLGIWPEEVATLVGREERRRFARRLQAQQDTIEQLLHSIPSTSGPDLLVAVETAFDLDEDDARLALALDPAPRVDPELWETAIGETTIWPPHPLQALTCEPVTGLDYRRLLLAEPDVVRAWVLPGLAVGVLWNGKPSTQAFPYRQGAFTFLVERDPGSEGSDETFLGDLLASVLTVDDPAETATSWFDLRTAPDRETPRRLLGDELCAAIVTRCPIVVGGTLELAPTANPAQVLACATNRLDGFLGPDRSALFEAPDVPGAPLVAPRDLEGPWPRAATAGVYYDDPGRESRESGWQPGDPVRLTELVQLLQTIDGVLGVDKLRVQLKGDLDWQTDTLEIDPYCVPQFDHHCLCTLIVDPRECDA